MKFRLKYFVKVTAITLITLTGTVRSAYANNLCDLKLGNLNHLTPFAEKVRNKQPVIIGYIGGSITQGSGASKFANNYYYKSSRILEQAVRERGSKAKTMTAAIGGTGSDYACYRAEAQLFCHKPDLLIIEFAVNDGGNPSADQSMECLVRQALRANPNMGIVLFYTATTNTVKEFYKNGKIPRSVALHHRIAQHYGLTEVIAGPSVSKGVSSGKWTYKTFFPDGVHPSDTGHGLYAEVLSEALLPLFNLDTPKAPRQLPPLLGRGELENAQLCPVVPSGSTDGWNRKDKQWNWYGVPIWITKTENHPISFMTSGTRQKLIYQGDISVAWTAKGKRYEKVLHGRSRNRPMPSSWNFPQDAAPESAVTVKAVSTTKGKVHGEVWGVFSIAEKPHHK